MHSASSTTTGTTTFTFKVGTIASSTGLTVYTGTVTVNSVFVAPTLAMETAPLTYVEGTTPNSLRVSSIATVAAGTSCSITDVRFIISTGFVSATDLSRMSAPSACLPSGLTASAASTMQYNGASAGYVSVANPAGISATDAQVSACRIAKISSGV